ncbi:MULTISPECIES: hypothetical protein [Ramlibacter]|uniref:Uncharacterized protein n=1 Tax=Ramlibacter pinisoli TaxID=2682844 RepID=A0A6N8IYV6_9BURK|nr:MULTISPECIES: hypothetical protein [Ramlibacter]MBA2962074.1 hypothetical protein [Ramlibacter sp. CGMCC 1.13660]MVQ32017.1 hypothetical protein [Ramlibacter pinisoli]
MHTPLTIKDLSTSTDLDRKAMSAVHGGQDNQALGTSQSNGQAMFTAANIGNGSIFGGPVDIQSDNTFNQDATNTNTSANVDALLAGLGIGGIGGGVRGRGRAGGGR